MVVKPGIDHHALTIAELEAEIERLRAALAVYADMNNWARTRPADGPMDLWASPDDDKWDGRDVARAALEPKP